MAHRMRDWHLTGNQVLDLVKQDQTHVEKIGQRKIAMASVPRACQFAHFTQKLHARGTLVLGHYESLE